VVAVRAGIEDVKACPEHCPDALDVVEKLPRGEGCAGAVSHHRVGGGVC
jgi:hypothetical protein